MKEMLTEVQKRLVAKVPELKYVDEDWGQLDYYSTMPPVKWPCALIDLPQGSFSNTGSLVQLGLLQVKIRVADMKLSNSSGAAPQTQKDKSFAFFDLLQKVHLALHGWSGGEAYSHLMRTAFAKGKRSDGVRLYEITYTCEWKDSSTKPVLQTTAIAAVRIVY